MRTTTGPVTVLALLVLAAGCLGGPPATGTTTPSPTPVGHEHAATQPDPDTAVHLTNEWNRSVTVGVRVVREATGATVHDAAHELAPDANRTVYSTATADPDGIETFAVTVAVHNATQRIAVETSACDGDVYGRVRADGTLYAFHAGC